MKLNHNLIRRSVVFLTHRSDKNKKHDNNRILSQDVNDMYGVYYIQIVRLEQDLSLKFIIKYN